MATIVSLEDWSKKKRKELERDDQCRIECENCNGTGIEIAMDCECPNCDGHEIDCDICAAEGMIKFVDADSCDQERLLAELYRKAVFDDLKALSEWVSDWQILAGQGYHLYSRITQIGRMGHKDQMCIGPNQEEFIVQRHMH